MTRLYALHCGGEVIDRATLDPFDADVGTKITIPYFCYVVDHPEGHVLFDTGAHRDFISNPERLGPAAAYWEITMEEDDHLAAQLATMGLEPGQIRHAAISHLHYDHSGGVGELPNAAIYVQEEELRFAHYPPVYQRDIYVRWTFDQVRNWKPLRGDYDVFNDGSVILFRTPGHTPGHQSMLVRTDDQAVILAGDAIYDLGKMRQRALPGVIWRADEIIESWERIEEYERKFGAQILITHEVDWRTKIRLAPQAWYG
jgi:N-acyl homoserine lactone hydrolase